MRGSGVNACIPIACECSREDTFTLHQMLQEPIRGGESALEDGAGKPALIACCAYVVPLGINRGTVKLVAISVKICLMLVVESEEEMQLESTPDPLCA